MKIKELGYHIINARFTCYRCEYIVLFLVVQLCGMGLAQSCSWWWLRTWHMILSYLSFATRCFRYGSFLLNLVLLVSAELISVCVYLHDCGSRWVWFENFSSLTVCSQFLYQSSTWIWNFKLVLGLEFSTGNMDWKLWSSTGTHISVDMVKTCSFITAKFVGNN